MPATQTDGHDGTVSPFEHDIAGQAAALRAFARAAPDPELATVVAGKYERIILTGMGSSHFAALPSWRRLVAAGAQTWWVDSGQLLDVPELVTPGSLLVVTSQSGASGEVVALLKRLRGSPGRPAVIGISNDPASPLARRADVLVALHSGDEATVSTKSYLNTLVAQQMVTSLLIDAAPGRADSAWDTVKAVEDYRRPAMLDKLAADFVNTPGARLAFIGFGDQAATALYAGLITKEAAKVAAEGFVGGQFRHGPLELAGSGLTAVLFAGHDDAADRPLRQLSEELVSSGSTVLSVGALGTAGALEIGTSAVNGPPLLAQGAITAQDLAVALAKARHIVPGAFSYGNKITTTL